MTSKLESPDFNKNEDQFGQLIAQWKYRTEKVHQSTGPKKMEAHKAKGKLTARERIDYLVDKGSQFYEFGTFAAYEMYDEEGGCPAAGVITGFGYVHGKMFIIVANDAMVKAGAWFPMTGKKNLRAQEIAMENRIPIIYLVDSAGVYLPMQAEIFPDKEHFGRIFRNNARMSSMGITQIAAVMGPCVAGGAYLPIMSDESLIVDKTGSIFLAGPYLVKAAIGEDVDVETLGGADTQSRISGIIDYKCENDQACLDKIRSLAEKLPVKSANSLQRLNAKASARKPADLLGIYPAQGLKPYNMLDVLSTIVDEGSLVEYKPEYGKTIICTYANVDGWVVGIVANQRLITKNGQGEMQVGGVIYSDSADKAARFIMLCNQKKIPLVFFHDVSGFMVGTRSEHGGIIKDGAKMVNAVANSTVPKLSIIVGNSYGAGNYAMCGKAYDPRFIVAWPTAKIAVMGGAQAAKVLVQIEMGNSKSNNTQNDEASELELLEKIKTRYEAQSTPYYAAARLWVDEIIDPRSTRNWISEALEIANHAEIEPFSPGVLQT